MYCGVIDIGSTTLRLSVYDCDRRLAQIYNKSVFTRLNENVKNNALSVDGMDVVTEGISKYLEELARFPSIKVLCFAGAFIRRLTNFQAIVSEIYNRLMIKVEVLSPAEEAKYALAGFRYNECYDKKEGLLVGVGGTSTLLVYYKDGELKNYASLPIGSVSGTKSLVSGLAPTLIEADRIRLATEKALKKEEWLAAATVPCVYAVSGNGRAFARVHKDLYKRKGNDIDAVISAEETRAVVERLFAMKQEVVLYLNEVVPGRINSFLPSAIILRAIMDKVRAERFQTARYGLREGFLLSHNLTNKE